MLNPGDFVKGRTGTQYIVLKERECGRIWGMGCELCNHKSYDILFIRSGPLFDRDPQDVLRYVVNACPQNLKKVENIDEEGNGTINTEIKDLS
jgi:hypothetical protein